jgi:hypothetical protein
MEAGAIRLRDCVPGDERGCAFFTALDRSETGERDEATGDCDKRSDVNAGTFEEEAELAVLECFSSCLSRHSGSFSNNLLTLLA